MSVARTGSPIRVHSAAQHEAYPGPCTELLDTGITGWNSSCSRRIPCYVSSSNRTGLSTNRHRTAGFSAPSGINFSSNPSESACLRALNLRVRGGYIRQQLLSTEVVESSLSSFIPTRLALCLHYRRSSSSNMSASPPNITTAISSVSPNALRYGGLSDVYMGIWRNQGSDVKVRMVCSRCTFPVSPVCEGCNQSPSPD